MNILQRHRGNDNKEESSLDRFLIGIAIFTYTLVPTVVLYTMETLEHSGAFVCQDGFGCDLILLTIVVIVFFVLGVLFAFVPNSSRYKSFSILVSSAVFVLYVQLSFRPLEDWYVSFIVFLGGILFTSLILRSLSKRITGFKYISLPIALLLLTPSILVFMYIIYSTIQLHTDIRQAVHSCDYSQECMHKIASYFGSEVFTETLCRNEFANEHPNTDIVGFLQEACLNEVAVQNNSISFCMEFDKKQPFFSYNKCIRAVLNSVPDPSAYCETAESLKFICQENLIKLQH
jgi:hypothetical protein